MFPVTRNNNLVHKIKGVIGLIMMGMDLKEGLNDDRFGFGRKVIENTLENIGGAFIGLDVLLILDVFGG